MRRHRGWIGWVALAVSLAAAGAVIVVGVMFAQEADKNDVRDAALEALRREQAAKVDAGEPTVAPTPEQITGNPEVVAGEPGQPGPAGDPGAQGPSGPAGSQGAAGRDAVTPPCATTPPSFCVGAPGQQGASGQPGVGSQGPQGIQGPSGEVGPVGAGGPAGPQGNPGVDGAPGVNGTNGAPGAQGPAGPVPTQFIIDRPIGPDWVCTDPEQDLTYTCT